jgi:hypothetical protein
MVAGSLEKFVEPGLSVAVGIVLFNETVGEMENLARTLRRAIARLEESERLGNPGTALTLSVHLKNNGEASPDLELLGPQVRLSGSRENIGFGRAHNLLMREAFAEGAQFYLTLDPNAMLHPDALVEMIAAARRYGGRALVEASQFPEELSKTFDPLTFDTPWASSCCLLIPQAIYADVGGFDENIFMYCEDLDLSWRARAAGYAVKHAPRALVNHKWSGPGANRPIQREYLNSARYLAIKWGNEAFVRRVEGDLRANGWEIAPTPVVPRQPASKVADFSRGFSFAPKRWQNFRAIPPHFVIQRAEVDNTIDVVVRFHDKAQIGRLSRCLFSLYSQQHQPIQVLLMLQDFDDVAVAATNACVDSFDWSPPRKRPIVTNVGVPSVGDHRSRLWNAGVEVGRSRYIGFCDFDDLVYSAGYSYLLHRLQTTGAAAVFGTAFHVDCSPMRGFDFVFSKRFPPGENRYDFLVRNFCPPNSVLFDRSGIEAQDLYADVKISKTEDRRVLAVIVARYQTDWASVGTVVAEYILRSDGSNTVQPYRDDTAGQREWDVTRAGEAQFLAGLSMQVPVTDIVRMRAAERKLEAMEAEHASMQNSLSWRLTRPLRWNLLRWFGRGTDAST